MHPPKDALGPVLHGLWSTGLDALRSDRSAGAYRSTQSAGDAYLPLARGPCLQRVRRARCECPYSVRVAAPSRLWQSIATDHAGQRTRMDAEEGGSLALMPMALS